MAITKYHLLANMMHPKYFGKHLSHEQRLKAKDLLSTMYFEMFPTYLSLLAPVAQPEGNNWAFALSPPWRFGKPYVNLQI